jgi:hypothetical protein
MQINVTTNIPWAAFYRRWPSLEPPLRPHPDVCIVLGELIADHASRVLLLGVTPELADLAVQTIAIDRSDSALGCIWPGRTAARRALKGDWRHLPCAAGSLSAAIGDGSFNCLEYPSDYERVYSELATAVRPGGRIAVRIYVTPSACESIAAVRERTFAGRVGSIHALKWLLAMAICAERADSNVEVQTILRVFNREFPDRVALGRATGWTDETIAQLDVYERLPDVFSFPTSEQVLASVPAGFVNPRLVAAGTYELAERCPLLVLDVQS